MPQYWMQFDLIRELAHPITINPQQSHWLRWHTSWWIFSRIWCMNIGRMEWWLLRPGQAQQEPTPQDSMREAIVSSQLSPGLPPRESPVSGFTLTINQKIPKKQSAVTILNYLGRDGNKIAVKGIMTQALVCGLLSFNLWPLGDVWDGYWLPPSCSAALCCCYCSVALIYHQLLRNWREQFGTGRWQRVRV